MIIEGYNRKTIGRKPITCMTNLVKRRFVLLELVERFVLISLCPSQSKVISCDESKKIKEILLDCDTIAWLRYSSLETRIFFGKARKVHSINLGIRKQCPLNRKIAVNAYYQDILLIMWKLCIEHRLSSGTH